MVGLMAFAIRAVTAWNMDSVHGRWHKRFSAGTGAIKQPSLQDDCGDYLTFTDL